MNKDFEKYIDKRVWCKSEELAEEFLQIAHNNGYKWADGESLLEGTYWDDCKNYTYYHVRKNNQITYSSTRFLSIDDFIEYEPLCKDKGISQEETKGENKMNKEERLKLVFETISKIAGFEIKPYKEFYIVVNDRKDVFRINENLNLLYKTPDDSFGITSYNTLSILRGLYRLEEIKEPLLIEGEKDFLRNFKFDELEISTCLCMYDKKNVLVNVINLNNINHSFSGLEEGKRYSRAELEL